MARRLEKMTEREYESYETQARRTEIMGEAIADMETYNAISFLIGTLKFVIIMGFAQKESREEMKNFSQELFDDMWESLDDVMEKREGKDG